MDNIRELGQRCRDPLYLDRIWVLERRCTLSARGLDQIWRHDHWRDLFHVQVKAHYTVQDLLRLRSRELLEIVLRPAHKGPLVERRSSLCVYSSICAKQIEVVCSFNAQHGIVYMEAHLRRQRMEGSRPSPC
jgi:hypothetical protein